MPLDRVPGEDAVYIGSAFLAAQPKLLDAHHITHILTVLRRGAREDQTGPGGRPRLWVEVDDVETEDLVVHFPRCIRFIQDALRDVHDGAGAGHADEALAPAVYVHCAMGKSRSAAVVVAYLMWRERAHEAGDKTNTLSGTMALEADAQADAEQAVARSLAVLRQARAIAEPNTGFLQQLALWWRLGCPADADDAVARQPAYQRWAYQQDVQQSALYGRAPGRLWFRDEAAEANEAAEAHRGGRQLRCKKCRRVLATPAFVLSHGDNDDDDNNKNTRAPSAACPHHFVEPLSWMRPVLAAGALEGRLACPNAACGALVGRYAWQGFQCSCRAWVCPAFSLQRSRVDEMRVVVGAGSPAAGGAAAPFGIRLPPGSL